MTKIGARKLWKAKFRVFLRHRRNFKKNMLSKAFEEWVTYTTSGSPDEPVNVTRQ